MAAATRPDWAPEWLVAGAKIGYVWEQGMGRAKSAQPTTVERLLKTRIDFVGGASLPVLARRAEMDDGVLKVHSQLSAYHVALHWLAPLEHPWYVRVVAEQRVRTLKRRVQKCTEEMVAAKTSDSLHLATVSLREALDELENAITTLEAL